MQNLHLLSCAYFQAWSDTGAIHCERSDRRSGRIRKLSNIYVNNSEPENTTEQFASTSDYTPVEYENITESSNSSEPEDTTQGVRSLNIETNLTVPKPEPTKERTLSVNCKNPEATCVTVRCSLQGPIRNTSNTIVTFSISSNYEDLGEFSFSQLLCTF